MIGSYLIDTSNLTQTNNGAQQGSTATSTSGVATERGVFPFIPVGLTHSTNSFGDRAFYRVFSPGVELRLNANWQLTKAVTIQAGFTSMYMHDVVRGAQVNDYSFHEDGRMFNVRRGSSVNSDVFVYGVSFGLVANRF